MFFSRTVTRRIFMALSVTLLTQTASVAATPFIDIPRGYWASEYIGALNERGIIAGYADNTFHPNRPVSRAEFAAILAKSQGLALTSAQDQPNAFKDVPNSHWALPAIQAVVKQGWMSGYPGDRFAPGRDLTLGEMYVILAKADAEKHNMTEAEADEILKHYRDADELPGWARIPIASAIQSGITVTERSESRLSPNLKAVRASVATSIAKLINPAMRDKSAATLAQQTQLPQTAHARVEQAQPPKPQAAATQPEPADEALANAMSQCPAVNLVGALAASEKPEEWILVRADGKRFHLSKLPQEAKPWQAGQQVRVTGNLDAVNGTVNDPIVTVQTISLIEPYKAAPAPSEQAPAPQTQEAASETSGPVPSEKTTDALRQSEQSTPVKETAETVPVYFPNLSNLVSDPALMLGEPVQRPAEALEKPEAVIKAILQGPTDAERKQGFFMDEDLKRLQLDKLTVSNEGQASVIIEAPGDFQFTNTSVAARLSEQIRRTLKQFDAIRSVKISVQNPKNKVIWFSP